MTSPARTPLWQWALLAGLAVLGGVALLAATPKGLAVSTDSVAYIGAARNQAAGLGLGRLTGDGGVEPMTHFPPLYPLLLAACELLGLRVLAAARGLSAVAFAGSAFLAGYLVLRSSRSFVAALLGTLLFVASPHMLEIHIWAMTEGLYILLGLVVMILLLAYGQAHRGGLLVAAAVAVAAAYLTRYIGISLVAAAAAFVALQRTTARQRSRHLATLLVIALLPMAAWMIRNLRLTGSATNRMLQLHLPGAETLRDAFVVIWEWLVPYRFPTWGSAAILVLAGLAFLVLLWLLRPWSVRRLPGDSLQFLRDDPRSPIVLYLLTYLATLSLTLLLVDASTPIDQRLAAPLLSLVIILVASALPGLWRATAGKGVLRAAIALGCVLFLVSSLSRRQWLAQEIKYDAGGLAAAIWMESGLARTLHNLPPDILLYADNPEVVYFLSGRGADGLPSKFDNVTMLQRSDYAASLAALRHRLANEPGAVVVLSGGMETVEQSIVTDITRGLVLFYDGGEADVFVTPGMAD
jgi:hypothetical protein